MVVYAESSINPQDLPLWTVTAGEQLRRLQTGKVQDYVLAMAAGVVAITWWLGGLW